MEPVDLCLSVPEYRCHLSGLTTWSTKTSTESLHIFVSEPFRQSVGLLDSEQQTDGITRPTRKKCLHAFTVRYHQLLGCQGTRRGAYLFSPNHGCYHCQSLAQANSLQLLSLNSIQLSSIYYQEEFLMGHFHE